MTRFQDVKFVRLFVDRLPKSQQILGLFAVIVFLIYSWTLADSFYKLPSWIFYLTVPQILAIYAYAFSFNLTESVLFLAGVLFLDLTFFLWLRNKEEILARSTLVTLIILISAMWRLYLFQGFEDNTAFVSGEGLWWLTVLALGIPLAIFLPKIKFLRGIFNSFAERVIVFLYIYLPLSLISLIVVLIRNI